MSQLPPYPPLNLPEAALQMVGEKGQWEVFDPIRRRLVALTPEEWVRQHMIAFLQKERGVPLHLMGVEVSVKVHRLSRRCDLIIYGSGLKPLMVVELKAPSVALSQKVLDQVVRYNLPIGAQYLLISNGLRHYCLKLGPEIRVLDRVPGYVDMQGE
ncbi:MAG TPA: type I restriction enzyme HsdR N-terminal domain-containing protein [Bacteroidales bacterium]|nr:type I restriction enzyme HsdR N-terminal domain-containing protein [Bacteroidales bacterium]HRZ78343.1 type I restriction enzyme HsdR N-terminal domain-containing protein [Bacteroidales bacterium]